MNRILRNHQHLKPISLSRNPADIILTAQTDATNKAHIHHLAMAETGGAEIHPNGRWRHQVFSAALIGQESEHEVLEQAARVREGDVGAPRGVGGLL